MLVCKKILIFCAFACCGTFFAQNIQNPVLPGVADAGVMKYNGKYYIDQNIENTIAHYNSATFVNPGELRRRYEEVKKLPVSELAKNSPLLQDHLVPLPKYYTRLRGKATEEVARKLVQSLTKDGCWLSPLKSTSNPYKPYTVSGPSEETKYIATFVGDEHDTSPYPCTTGELCISVGDYIDNMIKLISYLEK